MRDIQKVNIAHTINSVALSVIGVYIPIYLLTLGYSLTKVLIFFAISHTFGLLIMLFLYTLLIKKFGLIHTFKIYYPLQFIYLVSLFLLNQHMYPFELVAMMYGAANYAYWMPMNILLIKRSEHHDMGKNLSTFFALPKLFGILGPLLGAILIPILGFWPVFSFAIIGVLISFLPLAKVHDADVKINLNFLSAGKRVFKDKSLFLFEAFDNIIEESEWFWGIYVYLIIGTLSTPGIIGSLESLGGAVLTIFVGKYADKYGKRIVPFAALAMTAIFIGRIFIFTAVPAYLITVAASLVMTLFLISYFSTIYKTVKGEGEEEFVILREIPTVLGRLIVFAAIFLSINNLRFFFVFPILFILLLIGFYFWKRKLLLD